MRRTRNVIWYTGVQRLGAMRTSAYSNLIPIVPMAVAILAGVFLTRLSPLVLKPPSGAFEA